jgi:hypothetical protein
MSTLSEEFENNLIKVTGITLDCYHIDIPTFIKVWNETYSNFNLNLEHYTNTSNLENAVKIENLPVFKKDRIVNTKYMYNNEIRIWDGKYLRCIHMHLKTTCKQCEGTAFCKHKKQKTQCKKCKGANFCKHKKSKYKCRICCPENFCEHKKRKDQCNICLGNLYCEHKKQKYQCNICCPENFCEHEKRKDQCRKCNGSAFCEHGKWKHYCYDCGGSSICEHKKIRHSCRECNEICFCKHDRWKKSCYICAKDKKVFCENCKFIYIKNCPYFPLCFACHCYKYPNEKVPRRYLMKQNYIYNFLKNLNEDFIYNKSVANGSSRKIPDFLFDKITHSIIIEIDENQHKNYKCEEKRSMQLFKDLKNRPLVMIRFNPDEYIENNLKIGSMFNFNELNHITVNNEEFERRIEIFLEILKINLENIPDKEYTEIILFYNQ